jgi:hypothetical protein
MVGMKGDSASVTISSSIIPVTILTGFVSQLFLTHFTPTSHRSLPTNIPAIEPTNPLIVFNIQSEALAILEKVNNCETSTNRLMIEQITTAINREETLPRLPNRHLTAISHPKGIYNTRLLIISDPLILLACRLIGQYLNRSGILCPIFMEEEKSKGIRLA